MANGRSFRWFVDPAFHPVRLVDIAFAGLPEKVAAGETLRLELRITNPYPYAIRVGGGDTQLVMLWKHGRFRVDEFPHGRDLHDSGRQRLDARGDVHRPAAAGRREFRRGVRPAPRGLYELV